MQRKFIRIMKNNMKKKCDCPLGCRKCLMEEEKKIKMFIVYTTADITPKEIQDYIWMNVEGEFSLTVTEITDAKEDKCKWHKDLPKEVKWNFCDGCEGSNV